LIGIYLKKKFWQKDWLGQEILSRILRGLRSGIMLDYKAVKIKK
jgi:hypothetical protein